MRQRHPAASAVARVNGSSGPAGALGTAMVGALIDAGAVCHVPYINPAEADRFAFRDNAQVELVADAQLGAQLGEQ